MKRAEDMAHMVHLKVVQQRMERDKRVATNILSSKRCKESKTGSSLAGFTKNLQFLECALGVVETPSIATNIAVKKLTDAGKVDSMTSVTAPIMDIHG